MADEADSGVKLTTRQLAKALNVSVQTVRNYYKSKDFPDPEIHHKGRQRYYLVDEALVPEFLQKMRGGS